ncbi:hypothetical protein EHF33_01325 [Deinococcus psychrotolerans]|uniref:Uncharacterized protein n=1 Tax=Deinococcus psychrotolerans TaxID=2489213 RepID=A0A3G8Y8Q8_9DEIO|nr:hypothetical protein [Deinococcus psychrotolerans]AZI41565.1 hypothetical protein EHF33_01325 [Deinococcus psychrotolerans]
MSQQLRKLQGQQERTADEKYPVSEMLKPCISLLIGREGRLGCEAGQCAQTHPDEQQGRYPIQNTHQLSASLA